MKISRETVVEFMSLFRGNRRCFGTFNPKSGAQNWLDRSYDEDDFRQHLLGIRGIGIVPIDDDGMVSFGAIDIDAHGDSKDIDLEAVDRRVREMGLPLLTCRSKSGGAHVYCFVVKPVKAAVMRKSLVKIADAIGFGGSEVFPKQTSLVVDAEGERQRGSYINLCCFDAMNPEQLRYPTERGVQVSLSYFIDAAKANSITGGRLVEIGEVDYNGAPPCIHRMITEGVEDNSRNEALYNVSIYMKRAFPEGWKDKVLDTNASIFPEPLSHSEAKKVINSVARRDYRYKCKEDVCKSRCDAEACVKRKYGITPEDKSEMQMGIAPQLGNLRKIKTDPVKWVLTVEGRSDIYLSTIELMDYRKIREVIAEKLTILIPPMKNERWQPQLQKLMLEAVEIDAPDEASTSGLMRSRLKDFVRKCNFNVDPSNTELRKGILMGQPVYQDTESTGPAVFFRGQDFTAFLKKIRAEDLKGTALWLALRDAGVMHGQIRIDKASVKVWYIPLDDNSIISISPAQMRSEF